MNDNTEAMEKLTFDFEAFPLDTGDVDGLVNLLTQIFLRTNVDCEAVAKALVEMSPLGCVYRPAEEVEDEDSENAVYGVLSMLELDGIAHFQTEIANLFLNRARKVATPDIVKKFEAIFNNKDNKQKNYLLVNERMLHFPDQIAAPAFKSLKDDLEEMKLLDKINNIIFVSKIRIANNAQAVASTVQNASGNGKKKLGKAEKKRRAAAALEAADVIFDNIEEEILFNNAGVLKPIYFQYSVENDVESDSKFHRIVKDGVTYLPYRRVTILSKDEFVKFVELVGQVVA
uniref:Protein BCCIP homolog n=1 Tax=Panagrolaimus superbus TaxID=310955 RepID=A0A914YJH8_9BILA